MPETVGALVAFLLLITPGFAFELMRERRRPAREYTAFRETAVTVVASVAFSAAAMGVLVLLRLWQADWFPDPVTLFTEPSQYIRAHALLVLRSLLTVVLLATGFAYVWHIILRRVGSDGDVSPHSAWWASTNGDGNPDRLRVIASVVLTDGTVLTGFLRGHDLSRSQELRNLVLRTDPGRAIHVRHPDGSTDQVHADQWTYMVVPAESVFRATLSLAPAKASTAPSAVRKSAQQGSNREELSPAAPDDVAPGDR